MVMSHLNPSEMLQFLIVDDDEDDRELFCTAVEALEPTIQCTAAVDGEDALHGLRSRRFPTPDVIFLDLNMPRLNGLQTLVALKKDGQLKDIPIVIYSTSKLEDDKETTARLGAADFITKPTALSQLQADIARILQDHFHIVPK
jgi:CheY-like chemotaxis protein